MLTALIARYMEAKKVWEAQFDTDCDAASISPEWDAYQLAGDAILEMRCDTIEQVKAKCAFILAEASLFDTVQNCHQAADGREVSGLALFLGSLVDPPVDAPVDKSGDIGDNR